jgi:hypothetical protein
MPRSSALSPKEPQKDVLCGEYFFLWEHQTEQHGCDSRNNNITETYAAVVVAAVTTVLFSLVFPKKKTLSA